MAAWSMTLGDGGELGREEDHEAEEKERERK